MTQTQAPNPISTDYTAALSDELLLHILSSLPSPHSLLPLSLVSKRWLLLSGLLRRQLTLLRFHFLHSLRLPLRFPNLEYLNLLPSSFPNPPTPISPILSLPNSFSIFLDPLGKLSVPFAELIDEGMIDEGVRVLARSYPSLRKLSLVVGSEDGLFAAAEAFETLQELELSFCSDSSLTPISAFVNLQVLRLVGVVEGIYDGPTVTDIGLTILAHGCKRLVKLELCGCEGSYDGISAIGKCCAMLEELSIVDHRMDTGWIAGLSHCGSLRKLRLQSCRRVDGDPGPLEHLGNCPTIETLHLQRCQLRDKRSLQALFMVCEDVKEVILENCWGLDDDMFTILSICRRVKYLSLEGCSRLTTEGLESVILSWKDLQTLVVMFCNNIKDNEVSPALSNLFSVLKELKWRPDSKSVLAMNLAGTGMRNKGGRFFKGVFV